MSSPWATHVRPFVHSVGRVALYVAHTTRPLLWSFLNQLRLPCTHIFIKVIALWLLATATYICVHTAYQAVVLAAVVVHAVMSLCFACVGWLLLAPLVAAWAFFVQPLISVVAAVIWFALWHLSLGHVALAGGMVVGLLHLANRAAASRTSRAIARVAASGARVIASTRAAGPPAAHGASRAGAPGLMPSHAAGAAAQAAQGDAATHGSAPGTDGRVRGDCVVCLHEATCVTMFAPCLHQVCCEPCALMVFDRNRMCPVCRAPITEVWKDEKAFGFQSFASPCAD